MPEFFDVLPPDEALSVWWEQLTHTTATEVVDTLSALDRITAQPITSPESLPAFRRSTVDGYAVRAVDTFGASDSLPAYLRLVGEVVMGQATGIQVEPAECALIHTGGMLPADADAVVMVEHTQVYAHNEIEVLRPVAVGENVLQIGEDVIAEAEIIPAGHRLHPQDIGALLAVGLASDIPVRRKPLVSLFSTGDELVQPQTRTLRLGQIRDINTATIRALCLRAGAKAKSHDLIPDDADILFRALQDALESADMVVVTAGSSVSVRDMTADTINRLGKPGVLVRGIAARPGKPTILAVVEGKPVIGLPGNPVSALVMFTLFGLPAIARLMGTEAFPQIRIPARAAANIPSTAGREDYVPVRFVDRDGERWAEPIFGKSNLIFTLVGASGLLRIPLNTTGLREGAWGEVMLF
jgi:molybdopterin molybdotransferase